MGTRGKQCYSKSTQSKLNGGEAVFRHPCCKTFFDIIQRGNVIKISEISVFPKLGVPEGVKTRSEDTLLDRLHFHSLKTLRHGNVTRPRPHMNSLGVDSGTCLFGCSGRFCRKLSTRNVTPMKVGSLDRTSKCCETERLTNCE